MCILLYNHINKKFEKVSLLKNCYIITKALITHAINF